MGVRELKISQPIPECYCLCAGESVHINCLQTVYNEIWTGQQRVAACIVQYIYRQCTCKSTKEITLRLRTLENFEF